MKTQRILLLLLPALLNACGAIDRRDTPAPVVDSGGQPPPAEAVEPVPAVPPAPVLVVEPSPVPSHGSRASVGAPPAAQVQAEAGVAVTPFQPPEDLALASLPSEPAPAVAPKPIPPVKPESLPSARSLQPQYSPAAEALVEAADQAEAEGDLDYASVALERAQRIEPRNPWLWNRLARLRLSQSRYDEAADLAAKSNALAGGNSDLKRANWQLVAQAKRARGDVTGARVAEQQAARLAP